MNFQSYYEQTVSTIPVNYALEQRLRDAVFKPTWIQRLFHITSGITKYAVAPGGALLLIGCLISPTMAEATEKAITDSATAVQETGGRLIKNIAVAFNPSVHAIGDDTLKKWDEALTTNPDLKHVNVEYDRTETGEGISVTDHGGSTKPYTLTSPDGSTVINGGMTNDGRRSTSITQPYTDGEIIHGDHGDTAGETTIGWDTDASGAMTTTTTFTTDNPGDLTLNQGTEKGRTMPVDTAPDNNLQAEATE